MTDAKYPVSGNIRIWWLPANGLANPAAPTKLELRAGMDLSDAVSWNDKDFGIQASNTSSDPAITATGNTQNRGAAQYGGSLSFYYPANFDDVTNWYATVWSALRLPGTAGYIVTRVDGLELTQDESDTAHPGRLPSASDLVSVFKVETAGYGEQITGEEAFRYTITFLPKGTVATNVIVRESAVADKPLVSGDAAVAVGAYGIVKATLLNREATRALTWKSSDPLVATVSVNGVVKGLTAGSADITATDKATGAVSTAFPVAVS